ncbi:hypothetical protein M422DRAFT_33321 [Sphaerobolus stellatus SS14]|uniref:Uncharacterized protein n=1 Tax=Sphaerobolus stellatus (strain SS14) TaxID=990650 RepID=A0A0C9VKQ4_SPHS4|nr:hypothetical protein M422DRAFT_33321 [Sphaerobolus stellatus SS14]
MAIAVRPSTSADPVDLLEAAMGGAFQRDPAHANSFQYCATTCFSCQIYFPFPNNLQNAGYMFSRRKSRISVNRTWRRRLEYMRGSCNGYDKDRSVKVDVRSGDLVRFGVDGGGGLMACSYVTQRGWVSASLRIVMIRRSLKGFIE